MRRLVGGFHMQDFLLFAGGCVCAGIGGEIFVQGLIGVAARGRWPRGVVAATLGAFATSAPELMVGVTSALKGVPEISLGDVTGSNVVNLAVILALPILFFGLQTTRDAVTRDLPFALLIFPLLVIVGRDGRITSSDAVLLLAVFLFWLALVVRWAARNRTEGDLVPPGALYLLLLVAVGLATLVLAGQLIVTGASALAQAAGIPPYVIGATIVAFGTSVPELATIIISSLRFQPEVGLQTILGSNIFNCLFIIPVAALIHPINVDWAAMAPTLAAGFAATLLIIPIGSSSLGRWRGFALIAIYVLFIARNVLAIR